MAILKWRMYSGHPQALIILTSMTMTILKWPVTTFFNWLNLNFVFEFLILILNKNVELEF